MIKTNNNIIIQPKVPDKGQKKKREVFDRHQQKYEKRENRFVLKSMNNKNRMTINFNGKNQIKLESMDEE